jgi:hypothetical protein
MNMTGGRPQRVNVGAMVGLRVGLGVMVGVKVIVGDDVIDDVGVIVGGLSVFKAPQPETRDRINRRQMNDTPIRNRVKNEMENMDIPVIQQNCP